METAIKHPVPGPGYKTSFVIFDIRALWRSGWASVEWQHRIAVGTVKGLWLNTASFYITEEQNKNRYRADAFWQTFFTNPQQQCNMPKQRQLPIQNLITFHQILLSTRNNYFHCYFADVFITQKLNYVWIYNYWDHLPMTYWRSSMTGRCETPEHSVSPGMARRTWWICAVDVECCSSISSSCRRPTNYTYHMTVWTPEPTLRYNTIAEFNVDSKAEYSA